MRLPGLLALFVAAAAWGPTARAQQDALADRLVASQPAIRLSPLGTLEVQFLLENRSAKDITAWALP